jgi:hypothetical protein
MSTLRGNRGNSTDTAMRLERKTILQKPLIRWGAKNRLIRPAFPGPTKGGDFGVTQDLLSKNGSLNRSSKKGMSFWKHIRGQVCTVAAVKWT